MTIGPWEVVLSVVWIGVVDWVVGVGVVEVVVEVLVDVSVVDGVFVVIAKHCLFR